MLVRAHEGGSALFIPGIEHGAVDEDDAHILESVIGVLLDAAAHARGVVGDDAADHARIDG